MRDTGYHRARLSSARAGAAALLMAASAVGASAGERNMSSPPVAGLPMSKTPAEPMVPPPSAGTNRCDVGQDDPNGKTGGDRKCGVMAGGEQMLQMPAVMAGAMRAMMNAMSTAAERAQEVVRRNRGD